MFKVCVEIIKWSLKEAIEMHGEVFNYIVHMVIWWQEFPSILRRYGYNSGM